MKKCLPGIAAIICALIFSAFSKPYVMQTYKLLSCPVAAGIVSNPAQWSPIGVYCGVCTAGSDLACEIKLNSTRSSYYHGGGTQILNSFAYANAVVPKQDYLVITETIGLAPYRIITSITPMHWDPTAAGGAGAYVAVSLGADLSYRNGIW
jgi:hypothetical protein